MHVQLGNVAPIAPGPPGEKGTPMKGQLVTRSTLPSDIAISEALRTVTDTWRQHSAEPPAWVEADDKTFESVLAAEFGCRAGRPKSWKETTE